MDLTKGTDCTEAFETFHVFGVHDATLNKFWVKKASRAHPSKDGSREEQCGIVRRR